MVQSPDLARDVLYNDCIIDVILLRVKANLHTCSA
jgi:hypothetical protein